MTFKEVQEMALYRVDETLSEADATVKSIIQNAINQGYMLLTATLDQRVTTKNMPMAASITLPEDLITIINVSHSTIGDLSEVDYEKKANLLYIRSKDIVNGDITLTYAQYPARLVADSDVLKIKDALAYALSSFAAYQYQLYRKKYSAAQLLLAEFQSFQGLNTIFTSPIPNE